MSARKPGRKGATHIDLLVTFMACVALLIVYHGIFSGYFPNSQGRLGHDYSYFLPLLLAGDFWFKGNGLFEVPWFTPAFCGGVPLLPNPQSVYYSVPQFLSFVWTPLASVYASFLTFAAVGLIGFYLLLRRAFQASWPVALLGGGLFMFNGFYADRMIIGHLTFQAFMLVPLLSYMLLRPLPPSGRWRTRRIGWDVAVSAALWAYMVLSGMFHLLAPAALSVVIIGVIHGMARGERRYFWARFAAGGVLGIALCSAKLVSAAAYVSHFPRADYPLPGVPKLTDLLSVVSQGLFVGSPHELANEVMANAQWALERHEFEYGVSLVPLVAIAYAGVVGFSRLRAKALPSLAFRKTWWTEAILVLALLCIPLMLNYYQPAWNAFLKEIWLFKNSATLVRWFAVFIPVVILLACLSLDRCRLSPKHQMIVAGIGVLGCLVTTARMDRRVYQNETFFDPRPVNVLHQQVQSGRSAVPAIERVHEVDQNGLTIGLSPIDCYEALFGYRLEHFPKGQLTSGEALAQVGDQLNVKNPACYVFPDANRCRPGDHFAASEREQASAFLRYRPFSFQVPVVQQAANIINLLSLVSLIGFVGYYSAQHWRWLLVKPPPKTRQTAPRRRKS